MREVFIHQDSARVGLCKSILDGAGIANFVRNALTNNSVVDMPSPIFFPALCVMNDEDYEAAIELLRKVVKPEPVDGPDWKCPACGEEVPATFDTCWKCGAEREPGAVPSVASSAPDAVSAPAAMISPDPGDVKIANLFRWLLIMAFLWEMVWRFLFPLIRWSPVIEAPPEVGVFFQRHGPAQSMEQIGRLISYFHWAIAGLAFTLCFCFSRYGRGMFVLLLALDGLSLFGVHQQIQMRGMYFVAQFHRLLLGGLLAMMFLPPLARLFSRKS